MTKPRTEWAKPGPKPHPPGTTRRREFRILLTDAEYQYLVARALAANTAMADLTRAAMAQANLLPAEGQPHDE